MLMKDVNLLTGWYRRNWPHRGNTKWYARHPPRLTESRPRSVQTAQSAHEAAITALRRTARAIDGSIIQRFPIALPDDEYPSRAETEIVESSAFANRPRLPAPGHMCNERDKSEEREGNHYG
jgi:hypothetical protein